MEIHSTSRRFGKNKACKRNPPYVFPNHFLEHLKTRAFSTTQACDGSITININLFSLKFLRRSCEQASEATVSVQLYLHVLNKCRYLWLFRSFCSWSLSRPLFKEVSMPSVIFKVRSCLAARSQNNRLKSHLFDYLTQCFIHEGHSVLSTWIYANNALR